VKQLLSLIVAGENLVDAVVYLKDIKKGKNQNWPR
jgi:hypothetical protein